MRRTDNFKKFEKKPKGSAIKEKIKQEKKKEKKERAAAIEAHFARKREEKLRMKGIDPNAPQENKGKSKASRPNKYPAKTAEPKVEEAPKPATKTTPTKKATSSISDRIQNRKREEKQNKVVENKEEKATKPTVEKEKSKKTFAPQKNQQQPSYSKQLSEKKSADVMPLNKFIAHSGVCARRDAAILVKDGKVTVNGEVVTDPGTKVTEADEIVVSGKKLSISKNFVYILLNKPKDYITTAEDPQGRKTVLDLIRTATSERVYPVGRLDRNTSGVLLLTNDGDLAQKLSHPKHEIKKVYEVRLDRPLTKADMEKIASGVTLEDGFIAPDVIAYADSKDKSIIGIEIHSGRNRIVRRIFEHMKYDVKGLDRVMFAGLTKKDVQRGNWRFLKEKEVRLLKYMNQSFSKTK